MLNLSLTLFKTASEYRNVLMASILVMSIAVKNLQVFLNYRFQNSAKFDRM